MSSVYEILKELNLENGSKFKIDVLKKHKDNDLLKKVLKMTYDHVRFNFGVGKVTLAKIGFPETENPVLSLENALGVLEEKFCTRDYTGNEAISQLQALIQGLSVEDQYVISRVIERDLKVNIGKTQINKVHTGLITKPVYMRCDVYSSKTAKNIKFPAIVQLKADGTYREFAVNDGKVVSRSRSGEEYEYPVIMGEMKDFPNGIYFGELTVRGIRDRAEGNGLLNSDNPPHDDIILEVWDVVSQEEYENAGKKKPCKTPYGKRWENLKGIVKDSPHISLIPHLEVSTLKEALEKTSEWMSDGFEGGVLKDLSGVFRDGTPKHQLKLKIEISAEMRCVGFLPGTPGTKREGKVGSIIFENDEGTIKGRSSGFNDKEMEYFTKNQEGLIGKVFEVQFNDLSKGRGNDYYALSHPRFVEFREDKDETDSLEKVFDLRQMAIELR